MKNTRKNVLPLLLAGVLLLSAGAYGTRAYFTDSAQQEVGIELTLGKLDIASGTENKWNYTPEIVEPLDLYDINEKLVVVNGVDNTPIVVKYVANTIVYPLANTIKVSNVRPGDAFTREFTFSNIGSLDQKISINNSALSSVDAPYTISIIGENAPNSVIDNGFILESGKSVKYTIKISVAGTTSDELYNDKNGKNLGEFALKYFDKNLIITALQPNDNTTIIN